MIYGIPTEEEREEIEREYPTYFIEKDCEEEE